MIEDVDISSGKSIGELGHEAFWFVAHTIIAVLVLAVVTGQIIRSGIFEDKAFTEAFPFTLRLRLIRNPNMALNGRFPTAVGDFKYEINR